MSDETEEPIVEELLDSNMLVINQYKTADDKIRIELVLKGTYEDADPDDEASISFQIGYYLLGLYQVLGGGPKFLEEAMKLIKQENAE